MSLLDTALAMDRATLATFAAAALILYLTPGADMMFTLASGIAGGPKAGMAAACGISCGVLVHAVAAAAGIASLLAAHPDAYHALRWAGAAYLAYLAWASWTAPAEVAAGRGTRRVRAAFTRGFLTNILNPKVALFVLALLPQFTDPAIGPVWHQILILGGLLALGGVVTDGAYGLAAGALANRLRTLGRTMNRVSAVVFGSLAARLALD